MRGGVQVSERQLEEWSAEVTAINDQIAALAERKRLLAEIIRLAGVVHRVLDPGSTAEEAPLIESTPTKLTDAIVCVLERFGITPMTPGEVRGRLPDVGYMAEHPGPYFYAASCGPAAVIEALSACSW